MTKLLAIAASIFVTLSFSSCGLVSGLLNSSEDDSLILEGTPVTLEEAKATLVKIKKVNATLNESKDEETPITKFGMKTVTTHDYKAPRVNPWITQVFLLTFRCVTKKDMSYVYWRREIFCCYATKRRRSI